MTITILFYILTIGLIALCFSGGVSLKKTYKNRDLKGRFTKGRKTTRQVKRAYWVKVPRKILVKNYNKPSYFVTVYDKKLVLG